MINRCSDTQIHRDTNRYRNIHTDIHAQIQRYTHTIHTQIQCYDKIHTDTQTQVFLYTNTELPNKFSAFGF